MHECEPRPHRPQPRLPVAGSRRPSRRLTLRSRLFQALAAALLVLTLLCLRLDFPPLCRACSSLPLLVSSWSTFAPCSSATRAPLKHHAEMASPWTNDPYAQANFTKEQVELYLERIALPKDLVHSPPSLELLTTLMVSHLEHVAKDTSPLHVPEEQWDGPSTPIKLSSAFTNMPESTGAFDRVVRQRKGAFCFA